ncbi:hypothetical protein [Bacillus cereus]|uniref:hypothetical protein n=1 Tax=Bacillus cereus TaxID=1396 RepID=UPI0018CFBECD|nr:hypothetical protein [Bacillus cereus]
MEKVIIEDRSEENGKETLKLLIVETMKITYIKRRDTLVSFTANISVGGVKRKIKRVK